jgi:hypothetical protein
VGDDFALVIALPGGCGALSRSIMAPQLRDCYDEAPTHTPSARPHGPHRPRGRRGRRHLAPAYPYARSHRRSHQPRRLLATIVG